MEFGCLVDYPLDDGEQGGPLQASMVVHVIDEHSFDITMVAGQFDDALDVEVSQQKTFVDA